MNTNELDLYMRYLGALGLLAEASVYLPNGYEGEELRDSITRAFKDAVANHPQLRWRRILNRIEIESVATREEPCAMHRRGPTCRCGYPTD